MTVLCRASTQTHVGNIRELNEDAIYSNEEKQIWCVADGMGGYDSGDVASAMVVNAIANVRGDKTLHETVSDISGAIEQVNAQLTVERTLTAPDQLIGCTVLALTIKNKECACVWAGDSRLYLYRDGCLYQMSKDHSVVQELFDNQLISEQEIDNHPQSHVITRAVGVDSDLELDSISFDVQPLDVLLICSDGLYSELSPDQIMQVLSQYPNCQDKTDALIQRVLQGTASDNVSVGVIDVISGDTQSQ